MGKKIQVLIIDDSALVRQTLADLLSSDPAIEIMDMATDPIQAAKKLKEHVPDVITLDIEMPRMDGLTFLRRLMAQHPIPVVICSSLAIEGGETAMRALEYGAVDIITKPKVGTKTFLEESKVRICDVVKGAAMAKRSRIRKTTRRAEVQPKLTADAVIAQPMRSSTLRTTEKVVAIGASTGGTEAIKAYLEMLPADSPGTVIVQHMPEKFTTAFANRLDSTCKVRVKEANDGDTISRGTVLIAPGNRHMLLKRAGARYYVELNDGPLVSRHRPSVDVLFRSAAQYAGPNVVGVIMTGMGDDGAQGMLEMQRAGATNFAQDEATCVVFGMPNEAIKKGGVDKVLPLDGLAAAALKASET